MPKSGLSSSRASVKGPRSWMNYCATTTLARLELAACVTNNRIVKERPEAEASDDWPPARGRGSHQDGLPRPALGGTRSRHPTRAGLTLPAIDGRARPTSDSVDRRDRASRSERTPVGSRRGPSRSMRAGPMSPRRPASVPVRDPIGVYSERGRISKVILRKEVIQPQVPLRLPCYDLVPITGFIFGACLAAPATSDAPRFGGLTGGVYKAQEHIHRGMLIRDY